MIGLPEKHEAAPYYFTYISRINQADILAVLEIQEYDFLAFARAIPEEKSLHRYGPDKWSIREVVSHVNDTERAFVFRALWFARGFETPLPGFDQHIAAAGAGADNVPWSAHIEDFRAVRRATISFFKNLAEPAWSKTGIASDNSFTVRSLAFITAGHLTHHKEILKDRYLK